MAHIHVEGEDGPQQYARINILENGYAVCISGNRRGTGHIENESTEAVYPEQKVLKIEPEYDVFTETVPLREQVGSNPRPMEGQEGTVFEPEHDSRLLVEYQVE